MTTTNNPATQPAPPNTHATSTPIGRPFNLMQWIEEHKADLKPPVSNKQFYKEANDVVVFVSGGPNTRNDYHVNPTEELFFQLKGDIAVRVRPLDGSPPHDVIIREGETWLCPRWVPHRPQRPADTIGLIVEFPRGGHEDGLRWYCPKCDTLVHEAKWLLTDIDTELAIIMNDFWDGPESRRTCPNCNYVIQRGAEFDLSQATPAGAKR